MLLCEILYREQFVLGVGIFVAGCPKIQLFWSNSLSSSRKNEIILEKMSGTQPAQYVLNQGQGQKTN